MLFEKLKLEEDEEIITIIRKHWWILIQELLILFALAIIPLCIPFLFSIVAHSISSIPNPFENILATYSTQIIYLYIVWLIFLWMALGNFWTDYYLDLWAITNKRVVLVDQRGFFHRFVSSFRLERLQDMNIEIKGLIPTLLDYGTIEAQTAGGSNEKFIGYHMPHPRNIKALIVNNSDTAQTSSEKPL